MTLNEKIELEVARKQMQAEVNNNAKEREALEKEHGQIWDAAQLQESFTVQGFAAPFVVVIRKSDGKRGSLMFQHAPRYYWGFEEAES